MNLFHFTVSMCLQFILKGFIKSYFQTKKDHLCNAFNLHAQLIPVSLLQYMASSALKLTTLLATSALSGITFSSNLRFGLSSSSNSSITLTEYELSLSNSCK